MFTSISARQAVERSIYWLSFSQENYEVDMQIGNKIVPDIDYRVLDFLKLLNHKLEGFSALSIKVEQLQDQVIPLIENIKNAALRIAPHYLGEDVSHRNYFESLCLIERIENNLTVTLDQRTYSDRKFEKMDREDFLEIMQNEESISQMIQCMSSDLKNHYAWYVITPQQDLRICMSVKLIDELLREGFYPEDCLSIYHIYLEGGGCFRCHGGYFELLRRKLVQTLHVREESGIKWVKITGFTKNDVEELFIRYTPARKLIRSLTFSYSDS